jgi:predicted HTH transcriptional regulator
MVIDTSEKAFQNDIIAHLTSTGYVKRGNENYNKATCLAPELTLKLINISPDKVEIINPGKLLFPKEELGKRSVLRNPILVDLIYRLGLVEKAGSGIKRIQRLAKEDNINVRFKTGMFFEVIFHRRIRRKSDTNRTQIKRKPDTKTREKWILNYLKENKIIKSIDIVNQFSIVKDTVSRDLKSLIKKNKIVRKGRGNNVWYELNSKENENAN